MAAKRKPKPKPVEKKPKPKKAGIRSRDGKWVWNGSMWEAA